MHAQLMLLAGQAMVVRPDLLQRSPQLPGRGEGVGGQARQHPALEPGRAFGRRLKAKRAARGLSLSEFARQADVAKPTAWGWENGDYSPSMGSLRRITTVLDCTVDDLIEAA